MAPPPATRPIEQTRADLLSQFPFAGQAIHFIGIGGCGMNGLARLLQSRGAICSGSDCTSSEITAGLVREGIPVSFEHTETADPEGCDLVITSAAIPSDHPELLIARARDIATISFAEAIGKVQQACTGVSIAGTHGKSTTAAMLVHILIECGSDPSFVIGANCPQIGGGSRCGNSGSGSPGDRVGKPGIFVAEACEFGRSFHHHRPMLALINNIEEDHLDIYGTLDAVVEAFAMFARLLSSVKEGGHLLIAHEDAHRQVITANLECGVSTFGFSPEADYQVLIDVTRVEVRHHGQLLAGWTNTMPGEHNALNASAAAILASMLGAGGEQIGCALDGFRGLDRRMQRLGERAVRGGTVVVYDDYGHHPTEIKKTLAAVRARENPERLICVFQPHQHSRTRLLLERFAQAFADADVVMVSHIYFVRDSEEEKRRVNAGDLVDRLVEQGVEAMHIDSFAEVGEKLEVLCRAGDTLVIMGAGPVGQVAHRFLARGES